MNNQIQSIGSVLLEEYMKGYNVGFSDGTKEGKADAIDDIEVIKKHAEIFFRWLNGYELKYGDYSEEYVKRIIQDFVAEQLKEKNND